MPAVTSVSPSASVSQDIKGLLLNQKWAVNSFTFSFPTSASFYEAGSAPNGETTSNFAALNSTQQNYVQNYALAQFAAVANLTFSVMTETSSNHADLRFAQTDATSTAWGYYPATQGYGGDTWYRNSGGNYANPVIGNYAGHTFLHEIGHAMGLVHGHDPSNPFGPLPSSHDSVEYSIMTYRSYVGGPSSGGYTYGSASAPQTLMQNDIAALQYLYGANYSTHSGNTVYSWDPSTGQTFINGVSMGAVAGNKIFLTIWDGNGVDTYNLSAYSTNLSIDLQPGAWSTFDTSATAQRASLGNGNFAAGNVANALLYNGNTQSLIDNVIGGTGSDTIVGNVIANNLQGGGGGDTLNGLGGADVLTGGSGADTFRFDASAFDGTYDQLADYSYSTGDRIDLSSLISSSANLSSFVKAEATGNVSSLFVDRDGSGSTYGWTKIAQVDGVSAGSSIRLLLGGGTIADIVASSAIPPADLVVDSISAPLSVVQGGTLNFSYVVRNAGGTQAGVHWSGFTIDQQVTETNYQGYDTINSLAAGAALTFNNSISTAGLSVGQHTLYIEEDYWYNGIAEGDEGNNVRSITFNVTGAGAGPTDLVVDSISAPLSVVQGATLNFSYVVKNNGGTQAGQHWSGFTIDQQVTETNYQGYDTINSLAAGASLTFNNSISTAGLSVGQHTLYIEEDYWFNGIAEGDEGNNVRTITFNVTAATVPVPTITSFSSDSGTTGDGITNDNTLTLSGNAQANSTVRVYEGANLLGTTTASGGGTWSYTTAILADGSHTFTATATVGADTSAPSAGFAVTIDTAPPSAPTIASFSDDSGVVGDGITSDNTPTLTGTAQANSTVRVYDGANLLGTTTANGSGAWSYTSAALSDGAHSFTATAADAAGNISTASGAFNVTIDTTPPGSPADLVVDSISAPLSVVQGGILNFSYVVKNNGGTQTGVHWSGFTIDQQVTESNYQGYDTINSLAAGASLTFNNSISTAGLSIGQHTLYIEEDYWYNGITESDEGNNVRSITFNVTGAGPADLVVDSISAPLTVVQGATLNFSYVVRNNGGAQAGMHWSGFTIDQQVTETNYQGYDTINSLVSGASLTFNNSISTAGLSVGQHTLYIEEDYWYNGIAESSEGNNVRTITFNVTASGAGGSDTGYHNDLIAHDLPAWVGASDANDEGSFADRYGPMGNGVSTAQEVQHLNADLLTWTNESQWNGNSDQGSTDDDHQPHDLPVWAGAIDENDLSYFNGGLELSNGSDLNLSTGKPELPTGNDSGIAQVPTGVDREIPLNPPPPTPMLYDSLLS